MDLQGIIIAILEPRSGISRQGNAWKTQEYVIETQERYPRKMCFELYGDEKIRQANIRTGEHVRVFFDVDAHEWNGRWFNSIRAWKIERAEEQAAQPVSGTPEQPVDTGPGIRVDFSNPKDDLPF